MDNDDPRKGQGAQSWEQTVARTKQLTSKARALASEIDQGLAALKDVKREVRRNRGGDFGVPPAEKAQQRHRILLVEDHPVVSRGLTELLNYESDLCVCALTDTCEATLERLAEETPALVLLDLGLHDRSGLDVLREIRARYPDQRVLVISVHDELIYAPRALRAGALGYIMKDESTEMLLRAIRKVLTGGVYLSARLEANVRDQLVRGSAARHPLETLSDRELEVFRLIGRGMSNGEIAKLLVIRLKTVESHRTHIKQKLQLHTASELVRYAIEHHEAG
jgi:DNA-binding NarL/FixJ family response regulator